MADDDRPRPEVTWWPDDVAGGRACAPVVAMTESQLVLVSIRLWLEGEPRTKRVATMRQLAGGA